MRRPDSIEILWSQIYGDMPVFHFDVKEPYKRRDCIVIRRSPLGTYQAAPRPYVHPTKEAAESEARRLAVANPGATFTVFEAVSNSAAPFPIATTVAV